MYERASRTVEAPFATSTIIRGGALLRSRKVVLSAGAAYAAGSLLGVVTLGAVASAAKAGGNTGTGTFVPDAAPLLARAKVGVYTLRCIAAAANGGTFRLEDPDGIVLGDLALPGVAGGTVTTTEHIKGVLSDAATDFVVGDGFDVTVAAAAKVNGVDRTRLAAAAAVDGSQLPSVVLPYAVDAIGGDVEAIVHESGDFIREKLVLGTGLTLDGVREHLRRLNITFG